MSSWSTPGEDDSPPSGATPPPSGAPTDAVPTTPPTAPYGVPAMPPATGSPYDRPSGGAPPYGSPYDPQPTPYGAPPPPYGSPYGGPPTPGPYGSPSGGPPTPGPYGSPYAPTPYGTPYGPAPYGTPYGAAPYGTPYGPAGLYGGKPPMTSRWRGSAITLIVLSALLTLGACGLGVPSLVLGIIAMTRAQNDGPSGTRLARIGWIVFGVAVALVVVFFLVYLYAGSRGRGAVPVEQI